MIGYKSKIKTKNFLGHLEILAENSAESIVEGFQETEKELIHKFISDTKDLIDHNEWGVGLENLLENIYEIRFSIDEKGIDLARDAIESCEMDYENWKFIEELMK